MTAVFRVAFICKNVGVTPDVTPIIATADGVELRTVSTIALFLL